MFDEMFDLKHPHLLSVVIATIFDISTSQK